MNRQPTEASSVCCCEAAGNQCKYAEIALQNSKQIHTLRQIVVDVKMKNDEIIKWQCQHEQNPVPQETPEITQHTQESEEILPLIASKTELGNFGQNLGSEDLFEEVKRKLRAKMKATETKARLHEALYLIFNRIFLDECSWSGRGGNGPKKALQKYVNLFADVGNVSSRKVGFALLEI